MELLGLITALRSYHARFAPRELEDGFAVDVVESIEYWCSLGERGIAKDQRVNYVERAEGERIRLSKLQTALNKRTQQEQNDYQPVFETASKLIDALSLIPSPPDGYLGVLKIIREKFGFLETDYNFRVVDEQPTGVKFASDSVYVEVEHAERSFLSFVFGQLAEGSSFWVEDLLFMHDDQRFYTIPAELSLETPADQSHWFGFIAEVLHKYGGDILRGDAGAFTRLRHAQAKRDEEYTRQMERLHGQQSHQ